MTEEREVTDTFPLVSIVTPAYNAARHIRETIASVQAQTFSDWEMLVVDDCSNDETVAIVSGLIQHDHRIHLLRQERNGGPAAARQRALDAASARYIAFLDSDDAWLPSKLDDQISYMRATGAVFAYSAYRRMSEDGSRIGRLIDVPPKLTYRDLLKNTAIATSTVLLDRDKIGSFTMTRTYYDDYALWLALLRRGHVAYGLRKDLMRYRIVRKSVSRHKLNSAKWVWRTYRDIEGLAFPYATWCFLNYAWRAYRKYASF